MFYRLQKQLMRGRIYVAHEHFIVEVNMTQRTKKNPSTKHVSFPLHKRNETKEKYFDIPKINHISSESVKLHSTLVQRHQHKLHLKRIYKKMSHLIGFAILHLDWNWKRHIKTLRLLWSWSAFDFCLMVFDARFFGFIEFNVTAIRLTFWFDNLEKTFDFCFRSFTNISWNFVCCLLFCSWVSFHKPKEYKEKNILLILLQTIQMKKIGPQHHR